MTYEEFLHAVRAAARVADTDEFLVFGSQAILVHDPDPPLELRQSIEIDVVPTKVPERSDQIEGALGELSQFHDTHGFYVHGVGFETAVRRRCDMTCGRPAQDQPQCDGTPKEQQNRDAGDKNRLRNQIAPDRARYREPDAKTAAIANTAYSRTATSTWSGLAAGARCYS